MRPWLEPAVWQAVARELGEHRKAGLERLLTEDVVRFSAARALVAHGCDPATMRLEWPHSTLRGSRVDLVVGKRPQAFVELKYPREPSEQNAPWTMVLGHVLKDLYRLSLVPEGDRLFVYVQTARLERFMARSATRYGLDLDGDHLVLEPAAARALPMTATQAIGPDLLARRVTATRLHRLAAGDHLRLSVYLIDLSAEASQGGVVHPPSASASRGVPGDLDIEPGRSASVRPEQAQAPESGVRGEIHQAVRAVLTRSGSATFSLDEIVREMGSHGSRYAESTVRTMVSSHLCANAPDHAAVTYKDFERLGRGLYRPTAGW